MKFLAFVVLVFAASHSMASQDYFGTIEGSGQPCRVTINPDYHVGQSAFWASTSIGHGPDGYSLLDPSIQTQYLQTQPGTSIYFAHTFEDIYSVELKLNQTTMKPVEFLFIKYAPNTVGEIQSKTKCVF